MGAREARQKFSELIGRVHYGGETVILESSGKPMAAVVPIDMYRQMMEERDARFERLEKMKESRPAFSEEEVEADIAEALAAVRGRNVTSGT
ncbi:MAG TPA: type II toxin-antitoxin system Phd/YefM family antitoxin [Longimicrobium sp.]|jgi:prevent-host-death family protein|uniref:type II toxin-antitoxin system Phd/YefM family antitoxin n=1 Tax=Longimicrobium sp. TaxID=2029185 RepID=UPI002ED9F89A